MSDIDEQFTEEQAQELLEQTYAGTPVVEEPAATPVVETEEAAQPPAVVPEPEVADPNDQYAWVKDLPETVREKVLAEIDEKFRFKHQFDSNKGRIAAFQQKLLDAQKYIATHSSPATPQPATAGRQPTTPEGWQEVMKTDPELAAAIEARVTSEVASAVGSVRDELQELKKTAIAPLYEHNSQQYVEHQFNELERQVPNVKQVIASNEYRHWLDNIASAGVRDMALRSVDAGDAVTVLRQYADDMVRYGYAKPPEQRQPDVPATVANPNAVQADKIAAARSDKLRAQTVVPSTPLAPTGGISKAPVTNDEAQRLFLEAWKNIHKTNTNHS